MMPLLSLMQRKRQLKENPPELPSRHEIRAALAKQLPDISALTTRAELRGALREPADTLSALSPSEVLGTPEDWENAAAA